MNPCIELTELTKEELIEIDGGKTPSRDTSLANDIAYCFVYGGRAIWDSFGAFIDGASKSKDIFYK